MLLADLLLWIIRIIMLDIIARKSVHFWCLITRLAALDRAVREKKSPGVKARANSATLPQK
jgi:hypothetical protein